MSKLLSVLIATALAAGLSFNAVAADDASAAPAPAKHHKVKHHHKAKHHKKADKAAEGK